MTVNGKTAFLGSHETEDAVHLFTPCRYNNACKALCKSGSTCYVPPCICSWQADASKLKESRMLCHNREAGALRHCWNVISAKRLHCQEERKETEERNAQILC